MEKRKFTPYLVSLAISLGTGALSGLLIKDNLWLYQDLQKPPLSPPGWLFGVVWPILYILMGIGAAMIYTTDKTKGENALTVYGTQLFFNFFWGILFFNLNAYLFSFIWLAVLIWLVAYMIIEFCKIKPIAAYLQIPYLIWLLFAGYLNFSIYLLNR
ncbi:MAG: tryptophan-rich sensory protein [Clostridiales bacterium]|nr:tryptophan-rich sensory protein [Clostridiales bacterium]